MWCSCSWSSPKSKVCTNNPALYGVSTRPMDRICSKDRRTENLGYLTLIPCMNGGDGTPSIQMLDVTTTFLSDLIDDPTPKPLIFLNIRKYLAGTRYNRPTVPPDDVSFTLSWDFLWARWYNMTGMLSKIKLWPICSHWISQGPRNTY